MMAQALLSRRVTADALLEDLKDLPLIRQSLSSSESPKKEIVHSLAYCPLSKAVLAQAESTNCRPTQHSFQHAAEANPAIW